MNSSLGLFCLILFASANPPNVAALEPSFHGDHAAIELADEMFKAIGGKRAWAELRSLYIKAEHTEPEIAEPYQSKIWRGIDTFDLRIEQGNASFHVRARMNANGGTVTYLDERDSTRVLSADELIDLQFENDHNVYVVLHRLARHPAAFRAAIEDTDRLTFYEDDRLLAAFRLDDESRPHLFYQPTREGGLAASEFSRWGTHLGLVHSAGGGPLNGEFRYITLEWVPSNQSFAETYSFTEDPTP